MISYTQEIIYCDLCSREIEAGTCFEWREGLRVCLGKHDGV